MDLKELLKKSLNFLNGHSEDPLQEIQNILIDYFNFDRLDFVINLDKKISDKDVAHIFSILQRRKKDEPLAYIMNEAYFLGLPFYVNRNVLIPRYDTERSVEILMNLIKEDMNILEIGIGSGCVSIYCAINREKTIFHGVDISPSALKVAEINKKRYSVENVKFFQSDLFTNIHQTYDIIYSNPPYIPSNNISGLMNSVKKYEPKLALDGGYDGLNFYRKILKDCKRFLNPGGMMVFEIGFDQKEALEELFYCHNFTEVNCLKDYQHHPRVIWGKLKG